MIDKLADKMYYTPAHSSEQAQEALDAIRALGIAELTGTSRAVEIEARFAPEWIFQHDEVLIESYGDIELALWLKTSQESFSNPASDKDLEVLPMVVVSVVRQKHYTTEHFYTDTYQAQCIYYFLNENNDLEGEHRRFATVAEAVAAGVEKLVSTPR